MFPTVLEQTIIHYLESNKRLVVPQLGAFIVKVPGQAVVFSELLRTDDGVLRAQLCAQGMNELEAAGVIDRFVFEVRHNMQSSGEYIVDGLGVLRSGPNATIIFSYNPSCRAPRVEVRGRKSPLEVPVSDSQSIKSSEMSRPRSEEISKPQVESPTSPTSRMHPDPYIKGLRYGRPKTTTNAYRYVDRAPRGKGFDKLVLVAVVAAIIALATIAFVYIRDSRTDQELPPIEMPADVPTSEIDEVTPIEEQTQTTEP